MCLPPNPVPAMARNKKPRPLAWAGLLVCLESDDVREDHISQRAPSVTMLRSVSSYSSTSS